MGYALHIEGNQPFSPEEWADAVKGVENTRHVEEVEATGKNPATGVPMKITLSAPGAEVYLSKKEAWVKVFTYSDRCGTASLKARCKIGNTADPVWKAASEIARRLGAKIRGDEGEEYDLDTGEVRK